MAGNAKRGRAVSTIKEIDDRLRILAELKKQMAACAAAGRLAAEEIALQNAPATKQMLLLARLKQQADMAKDGK